MKRSVTPLPRQPGRGRGWGSNSPSPVATGEGLGVPPFPRREGGKGVRPVLTHDPRKLAAHDTFTAIACVSFAMFPSGLRPPRTRPPSLRTNAARGASTGEELGVPPFPRREGGKGVRPVLTHDPRKMGAPTV